MALQERGKSKQFIKEAADTKSRAVMVCLTPNVCINVNLFQLAILIIMVKQLLLV